jgi:hypothetical protein
MPGIGLHADAARARDGREAHGELKTKPSLHSQLPSAVVRSLRCVNDGAVGQSCREARKNSDMRTACAAGRMDNLSIRGACAGENISTQGREARTHSVLRPEPKGEKQPHAQEQAQERQQVAGTPRLAGRRSRTRRGRSLRAAISPLSV